MMTVEEALYLYKTYGWCTTVKNGVVYTETDCLCCLRTIKYPVGIASPPFCKECINKNGWNMRGLDEV